MRALAFFFAALSQLAAAQSCTAPSSSATSGPCPGLGSLSGGSTDFATCAYANCVAAAAGRDPVCTCAGAIVGIVIGCIAAVLIIVGLLMYYRILPHPACLARCFGGKPAAAAPSSAAAAAYGVSGAVPDANPPPKSGLFSSFYKSSAAPTAATKTAASM